MLRWAFAILGLIVTPGLADPSALYFASAPKAGDKYYDVFCNIDSIEGMGFDKYVKATGGSTLDTVVSADDLQVEFREEYILDALMRGSDQFELRDGGKTICANGKCRANTSTSSVLFNPLVWGDIPKAVRVGTTWTAAVASPWEIGPAGTETVHVIQIDRANGTIVLERQGSGAGPTNDDLTRKPPIILKDGKPLNVTLTPGATTWTGYTIVRRGVTVSEVIKSERDVTLKTDSGETLTGHERNYTLYNLAPLASN